MKFSPAAGCPHRVTVSASCPPLPTHTAFWWYKLV